MRNPSMQYEVEAIRHKGFDNENRVMYCIKWKEFPEEENTWEYESELIDSGLQEMIDEWNQQNVPVQNRTTKSHSQPSTQHYRNNNHDSSTSTSSRKQRSSRKRRRANSRSNRR